MNKIFGLKYRFLIPMAAGLGLLIYGLTKIGGYSSDPMPAGNQAESQALTPEPDIVLTGFKLTETEGSNKAWELKADTARIYQPRQLAQLKDIKADLYNDQGRTINLSGKNGEVNLQTKDMTLNGHIQGRSSDGIRFESERVHWNAQTGKLFSPGAVIIEHKNVRIRAQKLEADSKLSTLTLSGGVETLVQG